MLEKLLGLMLTAAFVLTDNDVRLYTRDTISDTVLNNVFNTNAVITSASPDFSVTLSGFQNVIDLADIGSVTLEITVTSRTSRFLLFCLWAKNKTDPRLSPIGEKGTDTFKITCNVANETATLELTNRMLITKPDGP